MMKVKWIAVLILCLLLALPVLAQVSSAYDLSWHVIAGGSGQMTGAGHILAGSIGQSVTGASLSSGHVLCSGFWCLRTLMATQHPKFLPLIIRGIP